MAVAPKHIDKLVSVEMVTVVRSKSFNGNIDDPRIMFLSSIDQRFGAYQRNLLIFSTPKELDQVSSRIEFAMEELLESYDFFSGRFQRNPHNQKFEIRCDNSGAILATARANNDLDLSALLAATDSLSRHFFYFPVEAKSVEGLPMLTIQVTGLSNGDGFAIGVLCHHAITDATSGVNFLSNLASISRGDGLLFHPKSDRSIFKARDPPQPIFAHDEFVYYPNLHSSRFAITVESAIPSGDGPKHHERKRRKIHFSFETLAKLKNSVQHGAPGAPRSCTTFEALAAYVWRYAARHSTKAPEETSRLRFLMNTRRIVQPPLDATFVGNAIHWINAEMPQRDLVDEEQPLWMAVMAIQAARVKVTDEYLRSGWDFLEKNREHWYSSANCDVGVNAWPRAMLAAQELDFGWGKPCRAVYPLDPESTTVVFVPVDDGIDVSLCLLPHQLDLYNAFLPKFDTS